MAFVKNKKEHPLLPNGENDTSRMIVESFRALDLPSQNIIVGSAALVLYGITLPPNNNKFLRPGDLDIAVDAITFDELFGNKQTPSGLPLVMKDLPGEFMRPVLRVQMPQDHHLPVDIITSYTGKGFMSPQCHRKRFHRLHNQEGHALPEHPDIQVASLSYIVRNTMQRPYDPKVASDLDAVNTYLSRVNKAP